MNFEELHQQKQPLLLANVWDVASAKVAEKQGFQAIGTSSAAIASMWGYEDGENIVFEELMFVVERIVKHTTLPLSVDMEAGYGHTAEDIFNNIKRLHDLGVVGINIEDSVVDKERKLLPSDQFSRTLEEVISRLTKEKCLVFVNVRTDPFLLNLPNALENTLLRIKAYESAGANGIFVPCIVKEYDIERLVKATSLPVNVLCMPDLPDFETLIRLGVKRISMGNFLFDRMHADLEKHLSTIVQDQSFQSIFNYAYH